MFELIDGFAWIYAQGGAKPAAPASDPGGGGMTMLLMLLPVFVLYYIMFFRPQAKQERVRRQMLDAQKNHDRVLTAGGVLGTVTSIDASGEKVVVRVDDDKGVKLTVKKSYIVQIITPSDKDRDAPKPTVGTASEMS